VTKIEMRPLTLRDATFVAANMNDNDWEECRCQIQREDRLAVGVDMFSYTREGHGFTLVVEGQPVVCFGVSQTLLPTLCHAWMYGTWRSWRGVPFLTRYVKETFIPSLLKEGIMRVEARALASHVRAQRWLIKMGAMWDCRLYNHGKNGEDFVQFSWWKDMYNADHVRGGNLTLWGINPVGTFSGVDDVGQLGRCKLDPGRDGDGLRVNDHRNDVRV
jgi:hypothetical protein